MSKYALTSDYELNLQLKKYCGINDLLTLHPFSKGGVFFKKKMLHEDAWEITYCIESLGFLYQAEINFSTHVLTIKHFEHNVRNKFSTAKLIAGILKNTPSSKIHLIKYNAEGSWKNLTSQPDYYICAIMGFSVALESMPEIIELMHEHGISEVDPDSLFTTPMGIELWKDKGKQVRFYFVTTKDSKNVERFVQLLERILKSFWLGL